MANYNIEMVYQATRLAIDIANNPAHGYNQRKRYGDPDFDCSSLVSYCLQQAGFAIDPHGTYTGNLATKLHNLGFANVINEINKNTGEGLQYGDILLTVSKHHTEFSLGYADGNKIVEAVHDENNTAGSDKTIPGDQTGDEIRIRKFYKWNWEFCFRWTDGGGEGPITPTGESFVIRIPELRRGKKFAIIGPVQSLLQNYYKISVGKAGVDGIYGKDTENAVKEFQRRNNLKVDGIIGYNTMKGLLKV